MTKRSGAWMLALVPLALAACGGENRGGSDEDTAAADTAPSPAQPVEPPPNIQQNTAMAQQQQVELQPVGGSGASGTVSIVPKSASGDSATVTISLAGAQGGGGAALPAHVHTGTCDNIGPVVVPLTNVQVSQAGGGTSTTPLGVPLATLVNGTHLVSVHDAGGKPIACAQIPPGAAPNL